ncbi:hypothetical protein [Streptosporangium sp. NPDC087985]|uniref:hypothetical protein n=1 Tax=Streptosporangium sp. NPDC087985 TaxID=3366196 RepID=UPI00382CA065
MWATLLDEGVYLCSVSTMYRLPRFLDDAAATKLLRTPTPDPKDTRIGRDPGAAAPPRPKTGPLPGGTVPVEDLDQKTISRIHAVDPG